MGGAPDSTDAEHGGPSRFLLVSDAHLYEHPDDRDEVVEQIDAYADAYDCDELLVAGDTGGDEDIEALLDADVPCRRMARGNHDPVEDYVADGGYEYAEEVTWDVDGYDVGMVHDPRDAGLRATADVFHGEPDPYDIVIYGHSHMPYTRVVDDTIAVGAGSLYTNYNVTDDVPDRSAHILEVGEQVTVTHINFESGAVVEESVYAPGADGFRVVAEQDVLEDRFVI